MDTFMLKSFWESSKVEVLCNPRMSNEDQSDITHQLCALESFTSHVWLATSGTTSGIKWVALSKKALLNSAKAVNDHLESTHMDKWLNPLPTFHVGGLGIFARGYLSGAEVINFEGKWDPLRFCGEIEKGQITLTSLVPTQVHDLVGRECPAPTCLRAVIVGGGALAEGLYKQGRKLGWPLLPNYGMTECASQIATAELSSLEQDQVPLLKRLSHVDLKITPQGFIAIKGLSLLSAYAMVSSGCVEVFDPKQDGWLTTSDYGKCHGDYVEVLGRKDDVVKITGENVNMASLQKILDELRGNSDMVIQAVPDPRLGYCVHLCTVTKEDEVTEIVDRFNKRVMPYERIRQVTTVSEIPRTPLGKPKLVKS